MAQGIDTKWRTQQLVVETTTPKRVKITVPRGARTVSIYSTESYRLGDEKVESVKGTKGWLRPAGDSGVLTGLPVQDMTEFWLGDADNSTGMAAGFVLTWTGAKDMEEPIKPLTAHWEGGS